MPLAETSRRGARLNWRLAVNGIHHASRLLVPRSRAVSATLPLRFPATEGKEFAGRPQARGGPRHSRCAPARRPRSETPAFDWLASTSLVAGGRQVGARSGLRLRSGRATRSERRVTREWGNTNGAGDSGSAIARR